MSENAVMNAREGSALTGGGAGTLGCNAAARRGCADAARVPSFVAAVLSNGFYTPIGVVTVLSLHGLPFFVRSFCYC